MVTKSSTIRTSCKLYKYEEKRWETLPKNRAALQPLHMEFGESFQQCYPWNWKIMCPEYAHQILAQLNHGWPSDHLFDQNNSYKKKKWHQVLSKFSLFSSSFS